MKKQKNLAFISLILGIVGCLTGIVIVGAAFGIAAIVLGIMSSGNLKNAKDRRLAQIGIITGAVAIAYTAVLYAWVGLHPAVTKKEPLLPETTVSREQQETGTESTAPVATVTPTPSPKPTAKAEPTVRPTQKPTATPTKAPTKAPTKTPTAPPTQEPTKTPTAPPTQEPAKTPAEEPAKTPTAPSTQEPAKTPAEEPAATSSNTPDTVDEEVKESPNTGNPGTDSKKTETGKNGTDSKKTDSAKNGTDSKKTESGENGTDSKKTESGKNGTDSKKTDSGKNGTDSKKTDSGKNGTDSGKTDSDINGTGTESANSGTESEPEAKALLKIHFLDVGQGACALIESDGHYMLIDGGGRDSSSFTVSYLAQLGIEKFDYMVATHFDEDHIAGLIGVFNKFAVETVLEPSYETDTSIYKSFKEAENNSKAKVIIPEPGEEYTLGDAKFTVLAPKKPEKDTDQETAAEGLKENNQSICILLKNGDNKVLFTGDAEQEEEQYLVDSGRDIRADVYMVGHHGSGSFFRTDEQGNIIMTSDGETITWNAEPSQTWAPGVVPEKAPDRSGNTESAKNTDTDTSVNSDGTENAYVLNNSTMKFHYPWCSSVKKIAEQNYEESSLSRDELLDKGYTPCGNCNP